MTQEQLAEAIGVSVDLISNIERGVNAPSFKTIEKLSQTLNVPPKELFDFSSLE
jgi:transcriptional regulator with XRE-family HTH domain